MLLWIGDLNYLRALPKISKNESLTLILQQMTLNIFCQNMENLYNLMDNLSLKVENTVAKGEIARFD